MSNNVLDIGKKDEYIKLNLIFRSIFYVILNSDIVLW